jgi:hypothetical protein
VGEDGMNYITVDKDKKITGHYSGDPRGIKVKPNEKLIEISDSQNQIVVGFYEDEYDERYKLRPLRDRVADGSARWIPENMTVDKNEKGVDELRPKTRVELVLEGKEELEPREKIEGGQIVEKTLEEKLADKLISQAECDQIKQKERDYQIRAEITSKMPEWLLQGLTWEQMQEEVKKIKDRTNGKDKPTRADNL